MASGTASVIDRIACGTAIVLGYTLLVYILAVAAKP